VTDLQLLERGQIVLALAFVVLVAACKKEHIERRDEGSGVDAGDAGATKTVTKPVTNGPCRPKVWTTELVVRDRQVHTEGTIALDGKGRVHASCSLSAVNGARGGLRYFQGGNSDWITEEPPFVGAPNYNALAVGADGTVHIAYRDSSSEGLAIRYIVRSKLGAWTPGVVFRGENPAFPSIVAARSGRIHVAFQTGDGSAVGYSYRDPPSDTWATERFDKGVLAHDPSLDVDDAGELHVAYADAFTNRVRYAHRPAKSPMWSIETVEPVANSLGGSPRSLLVDRDGVVHLTYATSAGLVYARRIKGSWLKEKVDTTPGRGCKSALALDASGAISVAYKDCTTSGLWFAARSANGAWMSSTLDAAATYLGPATLAVDASNRVHSVWRNDDGNLVHGSARMVCP
jgi:hypothetical protein